MGCDYYIEKVLEVTFVNTAGQLDFDFIELYIQNGYFDNIISDDSDDDESDIYKGYYHYLDVNYEPRVLFDNNAWKSEHIKAKYSDKLLEYEHIVKVVKKELREFRR